MELRSFRASARMASMARRARIVQRISSRGSVCIAGAFDIDLWSMWRQVFPAAEGEEFFPDGVEPSHVNHERIELFEGP